MNNKPFSQKVMENLAVVDSIAKTRQIMKKHEGKK